MAQVIIPQLGVPSFSCPHCGAISHQTWFGLLARRDEEPPKILEQEETAKLIAQHSGEIKIWLIKTSSKKIFLEDSSQIYATIPRVGNLHISQSYSCGEFGLWLHDKLMWPESTNSLRASEDMPEDAAKDFQEAAVILNYSPRAAAALLRLCIQKLCIVLGEKGKTIDDNIASLVKKGLDVRVQKALDIIRVIGNEAVHPGTLDLRDDKELAIQLFALVNLIVEAMITQPKHVAELYSRLPASKIEAIEKRDAPKAIESPKPRNQPKVPE